MKLYPRLVVASAALAAPAFASPPFSFAPESPPATPVPSFAFVQSIDWPATAAAPSDVTRTIVGDFDGDYRRDVVALCDGAPVFVYAPVNWSVVHKIAVPANDLDVARRAGPGGRDVMTLVDSGGLRQLDFNATTGTFTPSTISSAGAWLDARLVRCGDLNGDGRVDYVGGRPGDATIVTRLSTANGGATDAVFNAGTNVRDVAVIAWRSASTRDLAVLTERGLTVFSPAGAVLWSMPVADTTGDQIVAVSLVGATTQRLGWLRHGVGTELEFALVGPRGASYQFTLPSYIDDVYAVVGTDASHGAPTDGDTDLLICTEHDELPWFVQNVSEDPSTGSSGPYFDGDGIAPLAVSSTEPLAGPTSEIASRALPVCEDLDGDKRADYLAWTEYAQEFRYYAGYSTTIQQVLHGSQLLRSAAFRHDPVTGFDELLVKFAYAPLSVYAAPDTDPRLEIKIWRQATIWSELVALTSYALPIPAEADPAVQWGQLPSGEPEAFVVARLNLKLEEVHSSSEACFPAVYWLEIRPVDYVSPTDVKPGPVYVAYFAPKPDDIVTLWQPCYSLLLPVIGLSTCAAFPPAGLYSTPTCSMGSTPLPPQPILGTRRRVIPMDEISPTVPVPKPFDPDPLYSAWWYSPI